MQGLFEQTVLLASIVTALSALVGVFIGYVQQRRQRNHILSITEEQKLDGVLSTDNLHQLGSYLDETLNDVTIFQYSTDPKVADRVDKYLQHVQNYLGTTDEIEKTTESIRDKGVETDANSLDAVTASLPRDLKLVVEELRTGEVWNALARLRRHTEILLRELARSRGLDDSQLRSAGQILRLLRQRRLLDEEVGRNLDYVISVCNRAIHGLDVSQDQAEDAVNKAIYALQQLDRAL